MDNIKTGNLIREARKEWGLTQKALADQLHVTDRAVSKWERGICAPDIALLEPLSSILGVKVTELISGERSKESECPEEVESTVKEVISYSQNEITTKTRKLKRWLIAAGIALCLLLLLTIFSSYAPAIFQRGNPIPYLTAAMKIDDDTPYVAVDVEGTKSVYISRRGECKELFDEIESRGFQFQEQGGSSYFFSDGYNEMIVQSEIYWGKYTVWQVPEETYPAHPDEAK